MVRLGDSSNHLGSSDTIKNLQRWGKGRCRRKSDSLGHGEVGCPRVAFTSILDRANRITLNGRTGGATQVKRDLEKQQPERRKEIARIIRVTSQR